MSGTIKQVEIVPGFAILKQMTVISDAVVGGCVRCEFLDREPLDMGYQVSAILFGGVTPPKKGQTGLVALDNLNQSKGWWLGTLDNVVERHHSTKDKENRSGNTNIATGKSNFKINDDTLGFTNKYSSFTLDDSGMNYNINSGGINIGSKKVLLKEENSFLRMSGGAITLSGIKTLDLMGTNGVNIGTRGSVLITSGLYNSSANGLDKYGAVDRFIVKCSQSVISSANNALISAGALRINVGSGKLNGDLKPGKGSSQSFSLGVIQGNADFCLSAGNLNISSFGPGNYIKIRAGKLPIDAAYSDLKLTREELVLSNYPIKSSLSLGKGNISLSSTKDTTVDATINIKLSAKKTITLDATTNVEITATSDIKVEGKALITLKGPQLKMDDVNMIDAGEKTVTPTGAGPFCAIQTCPLFGIPHVGSQANG